MVDALHLAEAAHARVQRRHLGRPRARIGADLHDALVAYVGVDHAATTAVVAAGAGHHAFARRRGDARRFVEDAAAHARSGYHCAMPRPPGSLRARLAAAGAALRERHRPSGFGFALADSIDYLDAATWDAVSAGQSLFLQRRYLGALERACPDNLAPRSALIFRGRQPVAGVVMQIVTVAGTRLMKPLAAAPGRGGLRSACALLSRTLSPVVRRAGEAVRERVLVCGNLLSWGFHAVAFARDEDPAAIWPPVAEAIYRLRPAERLSRPSGFPLVKDLSVAERDGAQALRRFGYRPVESDPNMVLEIQPEWRAARHTPPRPHPQRKKTPRPKGQELSPAPRAARRPPPLWPGAPTA